jgi:hypothetical protein
MLATVFLGFSPVVREKRGGENKMSPVGVKSIALPLCTIGFDRNFESPIPFFHTVSPFRIATSGGECQ